MTCAHRITRWAHRQNTTTKQWFSEKANGNLLLPIPCYLFTYKYSVIPMNIPCHLNIYYLKKNYYLNNYTIT